MGNKVSTHNKLLLRFFLLFFFSLTYVVHYSSQRGRRSSNTHNEKEMNAKGLGLCMKERKEKEHDAAAGVSSGRQMPPFSAGKHLVSLAAALDTAAYRSYHHHHHYYTISVIDVELVTSS